MLNAPQRINLLNQFSCCLVTKMDQFIDAEYNGEDTECDQWALFQLVDAIDTVLRYSPDGYFLYKEGCNYTLQYNPGGGGTPPFTLTSVTIENLDGDQVVIPVGILVPNVQTNLQTIVNLLNAEGCGITLSDVTWVYDSINESGTLIIRKSFLPILSAMFTDSVDEQFFFDFAGPTSCQLYVSTESTGVNCDIDFNKIISYIKKECKCCPDSAPAAGCVNAIPPFTTQGNLISCDIVSTNNWDNGPAGAVCNPTGNSTPLQFAIDSCFDITKFYFVQANIVNYFSGVVQLQFDGGTLASYSANGQYIVYFYPTTADGDISIIPFSFIGCIEIELYENVSGWINDNRAWRFDPFTGCMTHTPGDPMGILESAVNNLVVGRTYNVTVTVGVTTGSLSIYIGGYTQMFTTSGTYQFSFTATDTLCYFEMGSEDDRVSVCALEVCPVIAGTPVEQTQLILGADVDQYISANGEAILIS